MYDRVDSLRHRVKLWLERTTGCHVFRRLPHGIDVQHDIARLSGSVDTILDVGANVGQSALRFREAFPKASIYCFEPIRETHARLVANVERFGCRSFRIALGSQKERRTMFSGDNSLLSSLHEPSEFAGTEDVDVTTVDDWCEEEGIDCIDVLKIDTEGHDLKVLAGANRLLESRKVEFVLVETGFDSRTGFVSLAAVTEKLTPLGMSLVGFYHQTMDWGGKRRLLFADALFTREG